jgi:hypothetical protein
MCGCFSAHNLVIALPLILWHAYHIFFTTCWVPTISVLNLAIFPCYSNLLLRSWRRFRILRWGVLAERLPPVACLWSCGVFPLLFLREWSIYSYVRHYSCNKYIILRHWLFYIHFLYGMCVNLIPGHTYYEYLVWVLKPGMAHMVVVLILFVCSQGNSSCVQTNAWKWY